MPLFHRKTDEERQREEAERQRRDQTAREQQQSLAALEAGGLPLAATRRLEEQAARNHLFTSDLSVNEFLLVKAAGYQPITQVAGSSIYHVGWQRLPGRTLWNWGSQELQAISGAMNHARTLALSRMQQEAILAGAQAVVGVRVTRARYDWGNDLIEFNAIGTAIRRTDGPATEHPTLSNLSGQEFWELSRAGYAPRGIVGASTVYYVVASYGTWRTQGLFGGWANQELQDFTAGLYRARHLALSRVHEQAAQLGAAGVIGTEIDQDEEEVEVEMGENQRRTDMIFTFHVLGTAIAEPGDVPVPPVGPMINLRDTTGG